MDTEERNVRAEERRLVPFGFSVTPYGLNDEEWCVSLRRPLMEPDDEEILWEITGEESFRYGVPHGLAVEELRRFLEEGRQALVALEARQPYDAMGHLLSSRTSAHRADLSCGKSGTTG